MVTVVHKLSDAIAKVERFVARIIVVALPLMILANSAGRAIRQPIYWMDELAILTMVCLAMLCMSLTLKSRDAVSVTMLLDAVPAGLMKVMKIVVDVLVLGFAIVLLVLCYRWFDPLALMRAGFDFQEFSAQTFNFMYQEGTTTLGVSKFWFWLAVPIAAFNTSIHAFSNLLNTIAIPATVMVDDLRTAAPVGAE